MRATTALALIAVAVAGWWFTRGGPGGDTGALEGPYGGIAMSPADLAAMPPEMRRAMEDAVKNAASPEDLQRRFEEISQRMEQQASTAAPGLPAAQSYALEDYNEGYSQAVIQGWRVRVAKDLLARSNAQAMSALTAIDRQLENVVRSLPASRVASLRLVPVWLELKQPGLDVLHYKWAAGGAAPGDFKADSIDIPDVTGFLFNVGDQPGMMLHELSHAYHLRALGADYAPILSAYEAAKAAGLYANVPSITGRSGPAYALTNEKEYFAELTEAYFSRNDFFPYTKEELRKYDPAGFAMVEAAWVGR